MGRANDDFGEIKRVIFFRGSCLFIFVLVLVVYEIKWNALRA